MNLRRSSESRGGSALITAPVAWTLTNSRFLRAAFSNPADTRP